jgi:integrase
VPRGQPFAIRARRDSPKLFVVFYLPGAGDRPVWRSTDETDPREAQVRGAEIWAKAMRQAGQPIPDQAKTLARASLAQVIADFTDHLKLEAVKHRDGFLKRNEADLKLYLLPKTDEDLAAAKANKVALWQPPWTHVDQVTSASWEKEKLRLHKSQGGPLGWRSIQHLTNTLRHLLRFARDAGELEVVPELLAPSNKLVRGEKRPRRAFDAKEREKFLRLVYQYRPKVEREGRQASLPIGTAGRFYEALHFSLLRRGELWAMSARWMNRRRKVIVIPPGHSKSGEEEVVPLHHRAAAALLGQMKARGKLKPDEPIFGVINVRPAFEWAMAKGKFDRVGVTPHHTTRHTGATILAEQTNDREALKKAGRWRSNVVDDYLHVDAEHARPLMEKL